MHNIAMYVALIGIAVVLYALTLKNKPQVPLSQDQELEHMLQSFLTELEQENLQLAETIQNLRQELQLETKENSTRIGKMEQQLSELNAAMAGNRYISSPEDPDSEENQQATGNQQTFAFSEKYARVLSLSREGNTAEQIAKTTGLGLGEVNLVLSLAKRGETT